MALLGRNCNILFFVFALSCGAAQKKATISQKKALTELQFNADSVYSYAEKQVSFGARVPNTKEHEACKQYLVEKLQEFSDTVFVQNFTAKAFDKTDLNLTNIVGSFNPKASLRILLLAHWDTRPFSDNDEKNFQNTPILGANDGASGVAVLLEVARQLSLSNLKFGVDILLVDGEDYGQPHFSKYEKIKDSYCLGSQYWAKNSHVQNYTAKYGILLDMVGGKNALFAKEGVSDHYASHVVEKVWGTAHKLGFHSLFSSKFRGSIIDDHYYINIFTTIPTIDIIDYSESSGTTFGHYWHTQKDNMDVLSKEVMQKVGLVLLHVLAEEQIKGK